MGGQVKNSGYPKTGAAQTGGSTALELVRHCIVLFSIFAILRCSSELRGGGTGTSMSSEPVTSVQRLSQLPRIAGRGLVTLYRHTQTPEIGPRSRHLPSTTDNAEQAN